MSLLPKHTKEFGTKEYWNSFFAGRGKESFEWYGEYTELCGLLHQYMRAADSILVAGCGNSDISADLYRVGHRTITNVDVSEVVIRQMSSKYGDSCPGMVWCRDDLTNSQFSSAAFSCVLDKGTLDAIFTDDSDQVVDTVNKYLTELGRLLQPVGRLVCVSLLQEHILQHLLHWCSTSGWMIRVCRCEEAERATKSKGQFTLPVFVVVCTKLAPRPGSTPVVESCLEGGAAMRVSPEELCGRVRALQQYSAVTHALLSKVRGGEEARLELCGSNTEQLRYVLYVIDAPARTKTNLPMGVFIVPQRREVEWLFSSTEGRQQVLAMVAAARLVVVHLVRGQTYEDGLKQVQEELSSRVADLAPSTLPLNFKIPFLSVGSDVGAVRRQHSGRSEWCGEFVVEDVQADGGTTLRRLVFLDNPNVVQSEVRLLSQGSSSSTSSKSSGGGRGRKKRGGGKSSSAPAAPSLLDHGYLSCSHHLAMVGGLGLVGKEARVMLLGLGGGPLATFIHNNLNKVQLDTVELDAAMVEVARQWFGFRSGPRLTVTVMDGLDYCRKQARDGECYDSIMLDVDSKDVSVGMSCPPQAFVETEFLNVLATCLKPDGVVIMNVVCRDSLVWQECVARLKSVFGRLLCQTIPQEVNRVLYCYRSAAEQHTDAPHSKLDTEQQHEQRLIDAFSKSINRINNVLKNKNKREELMDLKEIMKCTVIL